MKVFNIEKFFLETWLKVSIAGLVCITISDVIFFPEDVLSLSLDFIILISCVLAYFGRTKWPLPSASFVSFVVLAAMVYQSIIVPISTTNSLSIILVIGFTNSVMYKGWYFRITHLITFLAVQVIFVVQFLNPELRFTENLNQIITVYVTYAILYIILNYGTKKLKDSYDKIQLFLIETNKELKSKAIQIEEQNFELKEAQEELHAINSHLESLVEERTQKIVKQNEVLLKYSYTNAHHLRGPVARILGLANLNKLTPRPDPDFIINAMVMQAEEIDVVVKKINSELDVLEDGFQG